MNTRIVDEENLFHQAIEIADRDERESFLDRSCGEDLAARRNLQKLIGMHFAEGRILDETRACQLDAMDRANIPEVGTMIGPYKLLQEIGHGGMGVVFMAEQTEPMKRKVALKVIKVGMDTRRVVARFESERQAMAMMDHPAITKVLDAGATETGRPYFVMELVRGKSITDYCDEKRLSVRKRLQIFSKVCNALEHAHQKGIIHRDMKPTNVMVTNHDGQPVPKIIDFGIAKAIDESLTEKTLFTNYGEMIGTPLYMSPEQAEMSEPDVDTRTDIYSLGVLLYELLTGTTPYGTLKKKSFQDIRDAIRSRDPQLASTRINNLGETVKEISDNRNTDVKSLHRFIQGDLDWILMKCLARDRNQRYQSAGEVSREIERHLNGEPVEAAAPSMAYRVQKFVNRHRTGVAVAASFAVLLLAGTLFSSWMAFKANRAEKLASQRLDEVIKERDRALAAEQQLAELERRQRNRVLFHRAASNHNANMVKRYLANTPAQPGAPVPPLQVKPMQSFWGYGPEKTNRGARDSVWQGAGPAGVAVTTPEPMPAPRQFQFKTEDLGGDSINVIVVADVENEIEQEEAILKSILENQRETFGPRDVMVAETLHKLGELASGKKNWEESEKYLRESLEILKEKANNHPHFSTVRLKIVETLKSQGQLRRAVDELQHLKEEINLPANFDGMMRKIESEIEQLKVQEKEK